MKKLYKWFKENVLRIKPIFKVKIEQSWFSEKYFCLKFSNNNGWTWEYLIESKIDIDSKYDGYTTTVRYFSANDVEYISKEYTTYDICRSHNDKVNEAVMKENEIRYKRYVESQSKANDIVTNFNSRYK
jgi:hypothetical protein